MTGREILINLVIETKGDWDKIYSEINNYKQTKKRCFTENEELVKKCNAITIIDKEYPKCFKEIHKPPFVLFYKGDISLLSKLDKYGLAIVGSRDNSQYGYNVTQKIIKNLNKDLIIVSGMAKGIDKLSHTFSIQNNLKTVAILGCGIDYIYPKQNEDIYFEILNNGGLILSEYPFSTPPEKENFLMRNRLIAALSKTVLLIESKGVKSGALVTCNYASTLGKNVACIPTRINEDSNCNHLIKDGAFLIEDSEDINSLY